MTTQNEKNKIILCCVFVGLIIIFLVSRKKNKNVDHYHMSSINTNKSSQKLKHPVLEYQMKASKFDIPASFGDPIRPYYGNFRVGPESNGFSGQYKKAYDPYNNYLDGPQPGEIMGVPVPQGVMKESSEQFGTPFYYQNKPLLSHDFFKPYGPNIGSSQINSNVKLSDTQFYNIPKKFSGQYPGRYFGSANSFAPFPEVNTPWEKIGILTTTNPKDNSILNVYRRPIAPLQDLFEYSVQDLNGFIIRLNETYLEDGDIVQYVQGKESKGKWIFTDYVKNKYIWM